MNAISSTPSESDLTAPLQQLVDAANVGDSRLIQAAFTSPASILDGFPPYAWQGPTAVADWWSEWEAHTKSSGITGAHLALGRAQEVEVSGDRAYLVVPAAIELVRDGNRTKSTGSLTAALKKVGPQWLIAGWAWTH